MTTPESEKRDLRIWQLHEIMSRVRAEDMTDAELVAVLAIFQLAASRQPVGNRPTYRIEPYTDGTGPS